jgi:hypothetical protein
VPLKEHSYLWWVDLFEPLFPPKVKTGPITTTELSGALTPHPLQQDETSDLLDPQVALIDKLLHAFVNLVYRAAVLDLFGHKRAALQLMPIVQSSLDLFLGTDTHPIARLYAFLGWNACNRNGWLGGATCECAEAIDPVICANPECTLAVWAPSSSDGQFQAPHEGLGRYLAGTFRYKL